MFLNPEEALLWVCNQYMIIMMFPSGWTRLTCSLEGAKACLLSKATSSVQHNTTKPLERTPLYDFRNLISSHLYCLFVAIFPTCGLRSHPNPLEPSPLTSTRPAEPWRNGGRGPPLCTPPRPREARNLVWRRFCDLYCYDLLLVKKNSVKYVIFSPVSYFRLYAIKTHKR